MPSASLPDSPAPPVLASAVAAIVTAGTGPSLRLFDSGTGRQVRSIGLPTADLDRSEFSPDWSRLAWITPSGTLMLYELDGDMYIWTATLASEQLAPRGSRLKDVAFRSVTGQLVVEWDGDDNGIGAGAAVVDPAHPHAQPVWANQGLFDVDGYGDRAADVEFSPAGVGAQARIVASPRQLLRARVLGPTASGGVASYTYECDGPALDLTQIACAGAGGRGGAIAVLVCEADGRWTGTLRQLVAPGSPAVKALLVSPDRTRLLAERADGWVTLAPDGSGGTKAAFSALQAAPSGTVKVLAWI
ncbi:hypothetical protein GCM10023322_33230 [Rugosimonospora acidiphila]|uniref:WD40-like Beta Propeller Repeat n=1 Tax=Rugosimonospora acidiphila TaxID=556531 RepID=A0ABP9RV97_9ACTN